MYYAEIAMQSHTTMNVGQLAEGKCAGMWLRFYIGSIPILPPNLSLILGRGAGLRVSLAKKLSSRVRLPDGPPYLAILFDVLLVEGISGRSATTAKRACHGTREVSKQFSLYTVDEVNDGTGNRFCTNET